jgi:hypothetical protein
MERPRLLPMAEDTKWLELRRLLGSAVDSMRWRLEPLANDDVEHFPDELTDLIYSDVDMGRQ